MVNDYEEKQIVILVDQEWYLYQAILNDNKEEVFRILSEEKINVNVYKDFFARTSLTHNKIETLKILCEFGARIDVEKVFK